MECRSAGQSSKKYVGMQEKVQKGTQECIRKVQKGTQECSRKVQK